MSNQNYYGNQPQGQYYPPPQGSNFRISLDRFINLNHVQALLKDREATTPSSLSKRTVALLVHTSREVMRPNLNLRLSTCEYAFAVRPGHMAHYF